MTEKEILIKKLTDELSSELIEQISCGLYEYIKEQFRIFSGEIKKEIQDQFYDLKKELNEKN